MGFELKEFGDGVGHFKGGLYGFAGSGKTHTAIEFALGIKRLLNLQGRIGFFDTETGVEYVNPWVLKETGARVVGAKSRALSDAILFIGECIAQGVSVAIVDSTTHIWEEVQKTFLANLNKHRASKNLNPKLSIEWQDRGPLNELWQKFTDAYLNSPLHIIICGRAANLWEMEVNQDTGKKELNKVGTKMKTQSDMAYEPSFLAEMEREQEIVGGKQIIYRVMTVLKDRSRLLDGRQFKNPTFADIKPAIDFLTPGAVNAIDTTRETPIAANDEGDIEWNTEKKRRAIFCEEIQGLLTATWPGRSAEDQKAKGEILKGLFDTYSWTAIESTNSAKLKAGLDAMPAAIEGYRLAAAPKKTDAEKVVEHFGADKEAKPPDDKKVERSAKAGAGKNGGK